MSSPEISDTSEPEEATPPAMSEDITVLQAEIARLRQIEAAAKEAYAFLSGRRLGFDGDYARNILRTALLGPTVARRVPRPPRKRR